MNIRGSNRGCYLGVRRYYKYYGQHNIEQITKTWKEVLKNEWF